MYSDIVILFFLLFILVLAFAWGVYRTFRRAFKRVRAIASVRQIVQERQRNLRQAAAEAKRQQGADASLLRGHDAVALFWHQNVRHAATPDATQEMLCVAAATAIERADGYEYDGRPIAQGMMTAKDFEAYFKWLNRFGKLKLRANAFCGETAQQVAKIGHAVTNNKQYLYALEVPCIAIKDIRNSRLRMHARNFEQWAVQRFTDKAQKARAA